MNFALPKRRTLALFAVLLPLAALLAWVALRSGPMAPVQVTQARVESAQLAPALFGIGTVEARHTMRLGPTVAARVKHLDVDVGDVVRAGQLLGEMEPVDLDERLQALQALRKRSQAALREATARQGFASAQAERYAQLLAAHSTSEELLLTKRQELAVADAALAAAREDLVRTTADIAALRAQRGQLRLVANKDGIVSAREAEPGSTVVAGQAVLEVIAPASLWINLRLDQISAAGLAPGLPAQIRLRSRRSEPLTGRVLRVEPKADAVTEELLAKVVFEQLPTPLPPLGELAEVTLQLPALAATPVLPNAALHHRGGETGVWQVADGRARFVPVKTGRSDLQGRVQIVTGLQAEDTVIVHSERALTDKRRVQQVARIAGVQP
ncbi:efflux RND transporter periplasmic adaptor subunit [Comamonas sp. NLF-1-9]|uniref:efflux RND transporter periplasmic adaptor subunit n=1 Tax=Comamonas sp. NLF-1-9 TaxID=2853163 RepID=UPI001C469C05|nr:efflux RND transporter periplasmic adaptor subunit [Comamonas sp. NLF-1-9]QXL84019.1 efflux RND transporter periplasmic adaptor subunit [Comamonas sp. NLF-1-9]